VSADLGVVHGAAPDRILFSYCLSMVSQPHEALLRARRALAPGGSVVVVDFADMATMPAAARAPLRGWLRTFHVAPLGDDLFRLPGARVTYGAMRYYAIARFPRGD
jgi:S-adenosylmethionine-diacylgycerolhomoserine-N-methlytransferase